MRAAHAALEKEADATSERLAREEARCEELGAALAVTDPYP